MMSEAIAAKKKNNTVDLLTGTPWKKIVQFSIPLFIGNLFQQLYNTADSIIVGRWVGHEGLAGVGVSAPLLFLLVSVFMGIAMGSSVMVAQYYGAKNYANLRRTLHTAIYLALVAGVALTVIGLLLTEPFLRFLNTPANVYGYAKDYMIIIFIGITAQMLYNMLSGFMRGFGDSRTPLYTLIFATSTNVVLDLIFVIPLGMGVAGAAWATIISQIMSAILTFYLLQKSSEMTRITLKELKIDWPTAREMLRIGVPSAIQQGVMSIGGIIVQGFVNSYGTAMIAGHNAAMKVDMFAVMPIMSFSMAMVTYTGQNIGAGHMDRVYQGTKQGVALSAGVVAVLSVFLFFFGKIPLTMFTTDMDTVAAGLMIIQTLVPFYFLFSITQLLGGMMRGCGETISPMVNVLMMNILVRIPLVYVFNAWLQRPQAIYLSQIAGWIFGILHMIYLYRGRKWEVRALERIKVLQEEGRDLEAGKINIDDLL